MEKFNRAQRRHDNDRLKNKRKRYWFNDKSSMTPKSLGKVVQYPAACSCTMCGNPRKMLNVKYSIKEQCMYQDKLHE
jgi:hypothetical protein